MTLEERQMQCLSTCSDTCKNIAYPSLALAEEVAEYIQKLEQVIQYTETFQHTQYFPALKTLIGIFINSGKDIGKIAKLMRHGTIPQPFIFDADKINPIKIKEMRLELGDVSWELNVADYYLHEAGDAECPTAQLTASLNFQKLMKRKAEGTIDGQGDDRRTAVTSHYVI